MHTDSEKSTYITVIDGEIAIEVYRTDTYRMPLFIANIDGKVSRIIELIKELADTHGIEIEEMAKVRLRLPHYFQVDSPWCAFTRDATPTPKEING